MIEIKNFGQQRNQSPSLKGGINCFTGQQVKFVDRLSILSREKTLEHLITGKTTVEYQN